MSERAILNAAVLFHAEWLRRMQLLGLATADDLQRFQAATDALIAYVNAQHEATKAVQL